MKRCLSFFILLILMFSLVSCGPSAGYEDPPAAVGPSQSEPEETAEADPRDELIKQYAGRYLNTEMILGGEDETDSLAAGWADRSSYNYIEITEDFELIAVQYADGKETVTSSYYFDPLDETVHYKSDFSDRGSALFTFTEGKIILDTSISRMIYEKTDELD